MWTTKSPLLKYYKKKNNCTLQSALLYLHSTHDQNVLSILFPVAPKPKVLFFIRITRLIFCCKYHCTVAVKVQTSVRHMVPEPSESVRNDASGVQLPSL